MKTLFRFSLLFVVFTLFLSVLVAQESPTPESPAEGDTVTIVTTGNDTSGVSLGFVVANVGLALGALITAFLAGGAVVGGSALVFIRRLRDDTAFKNSVENLYKSIPVPTQAGVRIIIETARETAGLLDEITDGQPNTGLTASSAEPDPYAMG